MLCCAKFTEFKYFYNVKYFLFAQILFHLKCQDLFKTVSWEINFQYFSGQTFNNTSPKWWLLVVTNVGDDGGVHDYFGVLILPSSAQAQAKLAEVSIILNWEDRPPTPTR